jgi:hypothetical protein
MFTSWGYETYKKINQITQAAANHPFVMAKIPFIKRIVGDDTKYC